MSSSAMSNALSNRTTIQIYRDCMRLITHISGDTVKSVKVRNMVRQQFKQNKLIKDEQKIEQLRNNAMQGLTNYLTITSLSHNNIKLPHQINPSNNNKNIVQGGSTTNYDPQ